MACGLACSALNASSCFQAVQAMHCHGCCASACLRMHSLHTLAASARFHRPAVNADAGFASSHFCIVFRPGISLAARSNPFFHHPRTATAIPALLLPLFDMVLQGMAGTQTNHTCLGLALMQCKLSMGRLLPQCACP